MSPLQQTPAPKLGPLRGAANMHCQLYVLKAFITCFYTLKVGYRYIHK